jgi:hypothetical protein
MSMSVYILDDDALAKMAVVEGGMGKRSNETSNDRGFILYYAGTI